MFAILHYWAMETTKELSTQSQITAENTVALTDDMALVAEKTLDGTVSMKIITVVTLFFLPGTFISACISLLIPDIH
jgi:Mg2+ and Co2+ transporter CorA